MSQHAGNPPANSQAQEADLALLKDVEARLSRLDSSLRTQMRTALFGDAEASLLTSSEEETFFATGGALGGRLRRRLERWLDADDDAEGRWIGRQIEELKIERLIGFGGMGEVYEARDERLDRAVAVKTVKARGPAAQTSRERFRREARLLSQLNHPGICQVYRLVEGVDAEDGTADGGTDFLVLELVDGTPLSQREEDAWPERRVMRLGVEIARALDAAHRKRIVHRDLKPANVVLTPEGRAKVLDFGIARLIDRPTGPRRMGSGPQSEPLIGTGSAEGANRSDALTTLGSVIGTVAYMSPEQARGEDVTEASDLFALGILLQELLGQPAYGDETSQLGLLPLVARAETQPVRGVDSDLAELIRNLESSDPADRPSATETAERLEWILAKPDRRRRRWIVGTLAAGLAVALAWGAWTWIDGQRRQRWAAQLGQQVAAMESLARIAHMMPLHSIVRERDEIRASMAEIETETRDGSRPVRALGQYALGKGHLALQDYESARQSLDSAWDLGLRDDEVALARSEAMGHLFRERLRDVELIRNDALREQQAAALEAELRDPALRLLREVASVTAYHRGLMAFFEGRFDEAVALADEALSREPWKVEAAALKGEVRLAEAQKAVRQGEVEVAEASLEQAEELFDAATIVARSDPGLHLGLCQIFAARLNLVPTTAEEEQRDDQWLEEGQKACARSRTTDPESAQPWLWEAQMLLTQGRRALRGPGDVGTLLVDAVAALDEALQRAPDDREVAVVGGWALSEKAYSMILAGEDSTEVLRRAVDLLESHRKERPEDPTLLSPLGHALTLLSWELRNRGEDASEVNAQAIAVARVALETHPDKFRAASVLGNALYEKAELENQQGLDPRETLLEAAGVYEQAVEVNATSAVVFRAWGGALAKAALHDNRLGTDPRPRARRAREILDQALEIDPTNLGALTEKVNADRAIARWVFMTDDEAEDIVRETRETLDRVMELAPDFLDGRLFYGGFLHDLALWQARNGVDPRETAAEALEHASFLRRERSANLEGHLLAAQTHALLAEWSQRQGADPTRHLKEGKSAAAMAGQRVPDHPRVAQAELWLDLLDVRQRPPSPKRDRQLAELLKAGDEMTVGDHWPWELLDEVREELDAQR